MSRIRGKDTGPELRLRRALHALGVRFRVHDRSLPGTPDISHKGAGVAVFVDGCFWHACPEHFRKPATNTEFWENKRTYVAESRARKKAELEAKGFQVIEVWEHEMREDAAGVAERVAAAIRHSQSNR